ncbi:protein of unknown function DUF1009 [Candidatus Magnetoovum chiemensis]|nr:protein of unknown function DUF1009 [Candidatus Magnetoovum chiemensis]
MVNKTLGLIAGMGELPNAVAMSAKSKGYKVIAIALDSLASDKLKDFADVVRIINVGSFSLILRTLNEFQVTDLVLVGKVPKTLLYNGKLKLDLKAISMLFRLRNRKDDTILLSITNEIERNGIRCRDITDFTEDMLTPEGNITKQKLTKTHLKDIQFGFQIAKQMGKLDIGQTVVVKNQAVIAVEAIEGTDRAIKRAGELTEGSVVVKVSKPKQDRRFDFPVVGLNTIETMKEAHSDLLALEAYNTLMIQKDEMIKEAVKHKIRIFGVNENNIINR